MDTSEASGTRQIALPIPTDLHLKIRVEAARDDKSMAEWIRAALAHAVESADLARRIGA